MFVCQTLTSEGEIEGLADAWRVLQAERGLAPFTDFDWIWAWWLTTGKRENAKLYVVVCRAGEKLLGVLPLAVNTKRGIRILRHAAHDAYYMRRILAADDQVYVALWEEARRAIPYDCADIKNIHENTIEEKYFSSFGVLIDKKPVFYKDTRGLNKATVLASSSRRLRRKVQKIKEAIQKNNDLTHGVSEQKAFLDEALPFLLEKKTAWCIAKGKGGPFINGSAPTLYRAMGEAAAKQKRLYTFWLREKGALIAVMLCFVWGDTLYAHTVAYEPAAQKYMPGIFLMGEVIAWAVENGLSEANLMEGEEPYKERFASGARLGAEYMFARSFRGFLYMWAYKLYRLSRSGPAQQEKEKEEA